MANQLPDIACMLNRNSNRGTALHKRTNTPDTIKQGGNISIDRDMSKQLTLTMDYKLANRELKKKKQGQIFKVESYCRISTNKVGNKGPWKRIVLGQANSHTRAIFPNQGYRNLIWAENHEQE